MIQGKNQRKEYGEILHNMKMADFSLNEKDLFHYTEIAIKVLYNDLKNNAKLKNKIKCQDKVIEKMLENKRKYRITDDIDSMSIQYIGLYDFIEKDGKQYIQVKLSIYFYDNSKNNSYVDMEIKEKYWNDVWVVTYQNKNSKKTENSNCENCGATMKYNSKIDMFECEYCGNMQLYTGIDINWEIVDIEVI